MLAFAYSEKHKQLIVSRNDMWVDKISTNHLWNPYTVASYTILMLLMIPKQTLIIPQK